MLAEPHPFALQSFDAEVDPPAPGGELFAETRRHAELGGRLGARTKGHLRAARAESDAGAWSAELGPDRPAEGVVSGRRRCSPIAPHGRARDGELRSGTPQDGSAIRVRQIVLRSRLAADIGSQLRVGAKPAGDAQRGAEGQQLTDLR